jgi:hypothetical protein
MIAQERNHLPVLLWGLALKVHQKVEGLPRLWAPIHHVAGLHQYRRTTRPFVVGIDEAYSLEDAHELGEGTVDITHDHNPWLWETRDGETHEQKETAAGFTREKPGHDLHGEAAPGQSSQIFCDS